MKPPSEGARRLLERYRSAVSLEAGEKARMADVIQGRVLQGDLPRFEVDVSLPSIPDAGLVERLWSSLFAKLALSTLLLGAAGGLAYQLGKDSEAAKPPPARPRAALQAPTAVATPQPPSAEANEEARSSVEPPSASLRPRTDKPLPSASASTATVDEEVKLINGAQAALRANNPKQALALVAEHADKFPSGKLTALRQVTRMLALCQGGRADTARREAADFLARHPTSPFADRVRNICATPK